MDTTLSLISQASSLFDRWRQYLSLRTDAEALVRLVAIECRRNLSLLSALRLEGHQDQADPDYLEVAGLLETNALEAVFAMGPKETRAREILAKRAEGSADDDKDLPSELLLRIYVRMTAMQKLLQLEGEGHALRDLRWRTRLKNVAADLRTAVSYLDHALSEKR